MVMEEAIEKLRDFEDSLLRWFVALLVLSGIALYCGYGVIATLFMWSCFIVIIVRSIIRVFDICFVMKGKSFRSFIARLLLCLGNVAIIFVAISLFEELLSTYDFPAIWQQIVLRFENLKERLLA